MWVLFVAPCQTAAVTGEHVLYSIGERERERGYEIFFPNEIRVSIKICKINMRERGRLRNIDRW